MCLLTCFFDILLPSFSLFLGTCLPDNVLHVHNVVFVLVHIVNHVSIKSPAVCGNTRRVPLGNAALGLSDTSYCTRLRLPI